MVLATTIIWQIYHDKLYETMGVSAGLLFPPATLASDTETYLRASIPVFILFYSSLWFIKLSFLVFFRRLGCKVRQQRFHWWIVFGFTATTWIISIGTVDYPCLSGTFEFVVGEWKLQRPSRFHG